MTLSIEHLLAVEPYTLSDAERRELDEALAADDDLLLAALSLQAFREAIDAVTDPSAADAPAPAWRAPAGEAPEPVASRRRRRWPVLVAAALLVAGLVATVLATRRSRDIPEFLQEPLQRIVTPKAPTPPHRGATRPQPPRVDTSRVLATFQADTATIELMGIDMPEVVGHNDAFAMTLYWRVRTPFPEDPTPEERWRIFVHFDNFEGNSRFQADHGIAGNRDWWTHGQLVEDRFAVLAGNANQPRGTYDVYLGWFRGKHEDWTNATWTSERKVEPDPLGGGRMHIGKVMVE